MAKEQAVYPTPMMPHQSPVPAEESSLPRIGGPSPAEATASLPRLKTTPDGTIVITKGGK